MVFLRHPSICRDGRYTNSNSWVGTPNNRPSNGRPSRLSLEHTAKEKFRQPAQSLQSRASVRDRPDALIVFLSADQSENVHRTYCNSTVRRHSAAHRRRSNPCGERTPLLLVLCIGSGADVAGSGAELLLKSIYEPFRRGANCWGDTQTGLPLACAYHIFGSLPQLRTEGSHSTRYGGYN